MRIVIIIPWTAAERSGSIRLLLLTEDISLFANNIFSFLFFLDVALALESPHIFVPPCVEGMFRKVIPWRVGPSEMFKGTPSHCNSKLNWVYVNELVGIIKPEIYYRILKIFLLTISSTSSCKFLQEDENCSDVAYSKYHNLFFIRLLNFCGFFSRSMWNLLHIAAS